MTHPTDDLGFFSFAEEQDVQDISFMSDNIFVKRPAPESTQTQIKRTKTTDNIQTPAINDLIALVPIQFQSETNIHLTELISSWSTPIKTLTKNLNDTIYTIYNTYLNNISIELITSILSTLHDSHYLENVCSFK